MLTPDEKSDSAPIPRAANALSVEDRVVTDYQVVSDGGDVTISGVYNVTVSNNGLLPVPRASYTVNTLSFKDSNVNLIEGQTSSIGLLRRGNSQEVQFEFELTESISDVANSVGPSCVGEVEVSEDSSASGVLLAVGFDQQLDLSIEDPDCSEFGGDIPDTPQPEPEPEPEPGPQPEPEPEPEPIPDEGEITSDPQTADVGQEVTFTYRDLPDVATRVDWEMAQDGPEAEGRSSRFSQGSRDQVQVNNIYFNPGEYTVSAVVYDAQGNSVQSASLNIEVNELQNGDLIDVSDNVADAGEEITFTYTGEESQASSDFDWRMGDGTNYQTQNVTHAYSNPGNYNVRLAVLNEDRSLIEQDDVEVTVTAPGVGLDVSDSDVLSMTEAAEIVNDNK